MRAHGLTLMATAERFTQAINAIHITDLQKIAHGRSDFAFVAVNLRYGLGDPHDQELPDPRRVFTSQNGINESAVFRRRLGKDGG